MIKRFFSYYKPHKRLFIIDFTCAVIVAILELAFPVAVQWFIDELLPGNNWDLIVKVGILLGIVYLITQLSHQEIHNRSNNLMRPPGAIYSN